MKNIEVEEQKQITLDILRETKKICDENNIMYFLGGGTLLGAVRHKGFIPWDDDVDIMLPREDYEKLLKIFNEKCDKKYKLLNHENNIQYYYPFAKIVDTRTKLMESNYKQIEEMGIYIDVFPIDYVSDNEKENKKLFKLFNFYNTILWMCKKDYKKIYNKNLKGKIKRIIAKIIGKEKNINKILQIMDKKICKKNNNTNTVACVCGRYLEKEIMPKSYMEDFVLVDFENEQYKAPIGYVDYLKKHYGDYMKLPPKDKQVSNHNMKVYLR